jgi:acyl-CoA synthetase (NDP forming)
MDHVHDAGARLALCGMCLVAALSGVNTGRWRPSSASAARGRRHRTHACRRHKSSAHQPLHPPLAPGEERWLDAAEIAHLLHAFGLRCLPSVTVQDPEGAIQAAEMSSDAQISLLRKPVQPMAPRGVEMFLGATRDPVFGPAVAFGTGGVQASLWKDVAIRLAPLCEDEAERLVDSMRGRVLLDGFRGGPRGDRQALVAAILQVSRLMAAVPEVLELDLNPLLALEPGRGVVAVDARVRVRSTASIASEEETP